VTITDDALRSSIRTFNAIRSSLKEIYTLHARYGAVSPEDLGSIVRGSMVLERDVAAELLAGLVSDMKKSNPGAKALKRIILAGSVCEHPDIYRLIEQAGADVVWDDLCTGSRYFEGLVDEAGDPIRAMARRYHNRIICPAKHSSVTGRGENLLGLVQEHGAQGVIFLQLKFCDPHSFDYPYLKETLDRAGIPSMLLEIEAQLPPEGQLATRFETFIQML
jgi:benzoyl-CoA reductase/2-hydroxyglutaryl-CoA dehydratase subunit BcrC/BadD/HgdB